MGAGLSTKAKLGVGQELIAWLALAALAFSTLFFSGGFHGTALEMSPYWLLTSCLVTFAFWLRRRRRPTPTPRWLRVVGAILLVFVCLMVPLYFLDWAAWYK